MKKETRKILNSFAFIGYPYFARDMDDSLYAYSGKPVKYYILDNTWHSINNIEYLLVSNTMDHCFDFVNSNDTNPFFWNYNRPLELEELKDMIGKQVWFKPKDGVKLTECWLTVTDTFLDNLESNKLVPYDTLGTYHDEEE